jgi:hypothetical protein
MLTDSIYRQKTIDFNVAMSSFNPTVEVSNTTYRVPVVIHVMETGNSLTQISDEQIREGIKQLNERYRKVPGSLGDGNGVDVEIEFALAVQDPNGNCTNGIVRYDMTGNASCMSHGVFRNSAGIADADLKALSFWNSNNYYNIWLISEIDNNNGGSGVQGYAYFAGAHGFSIDGAVILCSNWRNPQSTTGAHELGHAFNLYHTFEGDNGGNTCPPDSACSVQGDFVCDTPPHMRSVSNCNSTGTNSCDGGSSNVLYVHNYMDYSIDVCQSEFTAGQKARVISTITTIRSSFLESNGNLSLVPPSLASVAFKSSHSDYVCSGTPIQFTDLSGCTPNTFLDSTYWSGITFNWTFTNGSTVLSSTLQNPLITLTDGIWDISLAITNSFGTTSHTESGYITVGPQSVPSCQTSSTYIGNYWSTVNSVNFNTVSKETSSFFNPGYSDFSCDASTIVMEGSTHLMSIDLSAGLSIPENVEVYIDYDNSGTFEAAELVLSGGTVSSNTTVTVSGYVTIPTNAVEDTLLRMRVVGEAGSITNDKINCVSTLYVGDVEDYGIYIRPICTPPTIALTGTSSPSNCTASDGMITINGTGTGNVSWTGSGSGSVSGVSLPYTITGLAEGTYDIIYGTSLCASSALNVVLSAPIISAPVISAGSSLTFCDGGNVVLTSSYPSGNTWSNSSVTDAITVTNSGTYTVTYTDANGCSSTTSSPINVVVNPNPQTPTISTSGATTFCDGSSVTLTSSTSSGNVWSNAATSDNIIATTSGAYSVTYTDGNGCSSTSSITNVAVNPNPAAPTISTSGATTFCDGGSVTLTSSESSGNVWSNAATSNSIVATTPGSYSVTYTDGNGCSSPISSPVNVVVQPNPTVPIISTNGVTTFCAGDSVTLTSSEPTGIVWSNGAVSSSIVATSSGAYSVTNTDGNGCSSTSAVTNVVVNPNPPAPTISMSGAPTFCDGSSVTLTSSATSGNVWSNAATSDNIIVTTPGSYSVTYTDGNGCSSPTSSTVNVVVHPNPTVPTISASDTTIFCAGDSVILTSSESSGVVWSNGSTSDSIVATISGPYSVTYTGSNGCSSTSPIVDVVVNQLPTVTISSFTDVCDYAEAFSLIGGLPNGGYYNGIGVSGGVFDPSVAGIGIHSITYQYTDLNGCVNSTQANLSVNDCTDLLEIKTDEVLVYPNPASKTVFVKTKTYDIASINVFDATGRLIARYNGQSKNIEVDISNVAIGIYNLEIQIENKVFRTRLVKK